MPINASDILHFCVAVSAGIGALASMFQYRHDNLHKHEVGLNSRIEELEAVVPRDELLIDQLEKECRVVRARYDKALFAFRSLMLALLVSLGWLLHAAFNAGVLQLNDWLMWVTFALVVVALFVHIFGDIGPARVSQAFLRESSRLARRRRE